MTVYMTIDTKKDKSSLSCSFTQVVIHYVNEVVRMTYVIVNLVLQVDIPRRTVYIPLSSLTPRYNTVIIKQLGISSDSEVNIQLRVNISVVHERLDYMNTLPITLL